MIYEYVIIIGNKILGVYNCFMNKYRLWFIEILVWILLIAIFAFVGIKIYSHQKEQHSTGHVFFSDTDGLIVGSPVRFMGVQVGYISDVKIINDEAYVSFVITKKNLNLPRGIIASVEFFGLAGSKSLELYPPTTDSIKSGHSISVVEPIRINSFLNTQQDIATNIVNITNQFNVAVTKNNILQIKSLLNTSQLFKHLNTSLDNVNDFEDKTLYNLNKKMERRKKYDRK